MFPIAAHRHVRPQFSIVTALRPCLRTRKELSSILAAPPAASRQIRSPARSKKVNEVASAVAERLNSSGGWKTSRGKIDINGKTAHIDNKRVNIVSQKLCDDIINYIGPSLQRHVGCDIIDINPGVGLWSRALNNVLSPREHILMEPDEHFYKSYVSDLLQRPGVHMVPQSGIVWEDLYATLALLENQVIRNPAEAPTRNDTLLVTANIGFHPNKRFGGFKSASEMVIYQLITAIRQGRLFQQYGLVRMLIWAQEKDFHPATPRGYKTRMKVAQDAEVSCEWIHVVTTPDHAASEEGFKHLEHRRDLWLDRLSCMQTLKRMEEANVRIPGGRKMLYVEDTERAMAAGDMAERTTYRPTVVQNEQDEFDRLEAEFQCSRDPGKVPSERLKYLRRHSSRRSRLADTYGNLMEQWMRIPQQPGEDSPEPSRRRDAEWNARVSRLTNSGILEMNSILANYHLFHQNPPVLLWDRRAYEPLVCNADEFFPNVQLSLVDMQPKAVHPLLRQRGPQSSRAGDYFNLMVGAALRHGGQPISESFNALWPGASNLALRCPTFVDPKLGGMVGTHHNQLRPRMLTEQQWIEFLQAFMKWPFRPSFNTMVGRLTETTVAEMEMPGSQTAMGYAD